MKFCKLKISFKALAYLIPLLYQMPKKQIIKITKMTIEMTENWKFSVYGPSGNSRYWGHIKTGNLLGGIWRNFFQYFGYAEKYFYACKETRTSFRNFLRCFPYKNAIFWGFSLENTELAIWEWIYKTSNTEPLLIPCRINVINMFQHICFVLVRYPMKLHGKL